MSVASMHEFLRVLFWANVSGALLAFVVFTILTNRLGFSLFASTFIGGLSALALLGLLSYLQGRPEHGIPFVLLFFLLLQILIGKNELPDWISGIQIGIVAAISPLPGAIFGVASVFVSAVGRPSGREIFRVLLMKCVFSVLAWVVATSVVYKNSLAELISNTLSATKLLANLPPFRIQNVLKFWAMPDWAPGIGILYGLVFLVAVLLAWRALASKGAFFTKTILVVCGLLLLNRIWFHGITFSHINYTFLCFFPSVLAWFLGQYETITKWLPFPEPTAKRVFLAGIAAVLFLPSLGIMRNTLMLPSMAESGVPYNQAYKRVLELKETLGPEEYIFIPNAALGRSAVIYDGPPWKMKHLGSLGSIPRLKDQLGIEGKYFFWPQFATIAPPEIPGFRIIENTFNTTPVKILGIQISDHTPGHGYALYEKIP